MYGKTIQNKKKSAYLADIISILDAKYNIINLYKSQDVYILISSPYVKMYCDSLRKTNAPSSFKPINSAGLP